MLALWERILLGWAAINIAAFFLFLIYGGRWREQRLHVTVFDNLDNAIENGYYCNLDELTADQIIIELLAFAEDCEDLTHDELKPHVEAWIKRRKATRHAKQTAD